MVIDLDIGNSAVRTVQLAKSRNGLPQLTHRGEVALPTGAVVDGDMLEPAAVTRPPRELWSQAGLREKAVAAGLASQRVTVRQIELPELPESELADAVRLQAQEQLPSGSTRRCSTTLSWSATRWATTAVTSGCCWWRPTESWSSGSSFPSPPPSFAPCRWTLMPSPSSAGRTLPRPGPTVGRSPLAA